MSDLPFGALDVQADLSLDVDGVPAQLTGSGSHLVLSSPHPERVWAAAVSSALPAGVGRVDGPRAVGRVADTLHEAGLRLEVTGPHGAVATLGAGVSSPLGRATTGSAAVAPGRPLALAALAWQARRRELLAVASALAAVVLLLARRGRRRSR